MIYMDAITSAEPKISFVMGKRADWKKKLGKKKIAEEKEAVTWDTAASQISSAGDGTYSLLVKKKGQATGVCVQLNPEKRGLNVVMSSKFGGNAVNLLQVQGEHMILTDVQEGNFAEYDRKGKVTRKFSYGSPVDSVVKLTLAGMCFYGM